jgi:hypothetical protein
MSLSNTIKESIKDISLNYITGDGADLIANKIADDVFMTVVYNIVCDGTQGDVQRARALLKDVLTAGLPEKLHIRVEKFIEDLDKRGEAEAEKEFGLPNEEMHQKSDGTFIAVADMHEAYLRNAMRKMIRESREQSEG